MIKLEGNCKRGMNGKEKAKRGRDRHFVKPKALIGLVESETNEQKE